MIKSISIRIEEELLHKLHIIADYDGRSANSQIIMLIKKEIEKFEERNGEIEIKKENRKNNL